MMEIEIDSDELWKFRFNACDNQHDGYDRALWYNKKEKKFFQTCETKTTNYIFNNPNDIILLIWISGDNNSKGLDEVCEGCSGECDCEKGDILYEICFSEVCDKWYPIKPINYGTNKIEDIKFIEV